MDEIEKPFACTIDGCEMTFATEDHLDFHQKRHDMVLNLGLVNKNGETSDETPTPTRFIRNCEEVGLFQDLQNVNPFDETFKKAMELGKSGTLHVPDSGNDDTLHTPHIFPPIDDNVNKYIDNQSTQSSGFCISSVASVQEDEENYEITMVSCTEHQDEHINLKNKLKETIRNKEKKLERTTVIATLPLTNLKINDTNTKRELSTRKPAQTKKYKADEIIETEGKEKIRAMNRAAQLRCRKRKKIQWKRMEEEVKQLKLENVKLHNENQNLKHKFYALKELILEQKLHIPPGNSQFLAMFEQIINSSAEALKRDISPVVPTYGRQIRAKVKVPIPSSSYPVALVQNPLPDQKPILIQVTGSVSQLAVSVVPNVAD